MLSCEDDIADTIRPRLEAAGADLNLIHVIKAVRALTGAMRGFDLTQDLANLEQTLNNIRDVVLIVVDPITAYLGKATDSYKTADVRAVLAPLQELAARRRVAIVAISHFNKNIGYGTAINAITGSNAFVAASRATFIVTKDEENPTRRLLVQAKSNIADAPALAFHIQKKTVRSEIDRSDLDPSEIDPNNPGAPVFGDIETTLIEFEPGTVEVTADQAIARNMGRADSSKMQSAKDFLKEQLASGPVAFKVLKKDARELGILERTLYRAAKDIGVLTVKEGFQKEAMWHFPLAPDAIERAFGLKPTH